MHPDGKHIMIGSQPGYGFMGGGLIIYSRNAANHEARPYRPPSDYSTMGIWPPDSNLLCGTSPQGGTALPRRTRRQPCTY